MSCGYLSGKCFSFFSPRPIRCRTNMRTTNLGLIFNRLLNIIGDCYSQRNGVMQIIPSGNKWAGGACVWEVHHPLSFLQLS